MATFDHETKIWVPVKGPHDKSFSNDIDLGTLIVQEMKKFLPSKTLEIHCETETRLTVSQIMDRSLACAYNLQNLGIKEGDVVVIFSQVNRDVSPVILGSLLIGAIFNTFETTFDDDDRKYCLEILKPKAIFYDKQFESKIKNCFNTKDLALFLPFGDGKDSVFEKILSGGGLFVPRKFKEPANKIPAAMVFTSGSTGRPKAVILSHSLLQQGMLSMCKMYPNDIMFAASPLRWISHIVFILQIMYSGATRIVTSSTPNAELFCQYIKKYRATKFFGVVGLLSEMVSIARTKHPGCLDSLRQIISGGEVVTQKLRSEIESLLKGVAVISVYGMSEMAGVVAGNEFFKDKSINGGNLKYGFKYKVVDNDKNPLGPEEMGVLCIKFDGGYFGYQSNEKANKEAFLKGGWYYTGDFVNISSDGIIEVYGRVKDNIWCDGKLIIPSRVEQVVNQHPSVASTVVVGIPFGNSQDIRKGQMAAVCIKRKDPFLQQDVTNDVFNFLSQRMDSENMSFIVIKMVNEFPLTSCGKVDKISLAQIASCS